MYIYIYVRIYINIYTQIYIHIYVHILYQPCCLGQECKYIHIYIHIDIYIYMYCTYLHTHTGGELERNHHSERIDLNKNVYICIYKFKYISGKNLSQQPRRLQKEYV